MEIGGNAAAWRLTAMPLHGDWRQGRCFEIGGDAAVDVAGGNAALSACCRQSMIAAMPLRLHAGGNAAVIPRLRQCRFTHMCTRRSKKCGTAALNKTGTILSSTST